MNNIIFDVPISFPIQIKHVLSLSNDISKLPSNVLVGKNNDARQASGHSQIGLLSLHIENGDMIHFTIAGDNPKSDIDKIKEILTMTN